MLKTNSKKARENIRAYIMDNVDTVDSTFKEPATFEEAAALIYAAFYLECGFTCDRAGMLAYFGSFQDAFVYWCSSLPSYFDALYYYNRSAVDDLGAILEETEEEKARYSETDAADLLTRLVYREITKAATDENVTAYLRAFDEAQAAWLRDI